MKEEIKKEEYRAYLYKRIGNKTIAKVFHGETACGEAMSDGWVDTPAKVEGVEIPEDIRDEVEKASSDLAYDVNVLANCDKVEDLEHLAEAYNRLAGKPWDARIKNLKSARKACRRLLGELNGDSN